MPILLPIVGISLLMLVLMNSWLRPARSASESEVIREIRTLVLAKSQTKGLNNGGEIGSWWVSAEGSDAVTGTLKAFRVEAGPTIIAAKEADLLVDPDLNAFTFEMRDVVIIRLGIEGQAAPDPSVLKLDTYRLGPIPYHREIEPDSGREHLGPAPGRPEGEPSPMTRAQ